MKEHGFQKAIVQYLRMRGWITMCSDMMMSLKFIGNNQTNRIRFISYAKGQGYTKGQPDLIIHKDGITKFIEFKTDKGVQSPEQKEIEKQISNYFIVRNYEDVDNALK